MRAWNAVVACAAVTLVLGLAVGSARADNEDEFLANATGGPPDPKAPLTPVCPGCVPGECSCCPSENTGVGTHKSVDFYTGRESYERTDISIPGIFSIELVRRYDSQSRYDSALGYGWSFSYDLRLFRHRDAAVTIRGICGDRMRFVPTGGAYQRVDAKAPGGPKLTESNGTYTLQWTVGTKAVFLNTDDGRLSYMENLRGHRLVFTYSATKLPIIGTSPFATNPATPLVVAYQYQLSSVEESLKSGASSWQPTGRKLKFTYDNGGPNPTGRLTRVDSYDGRYVTYARDADGNLTGVYRSVDATTTIHATYTYTLNGEGGDRHNLKSSAEGDGTQSVTRDYDTKERVYHEQQGASSITIDFNDGVTTPIRRTVTTAVDDDGTGTPYNKVESYEFDASGLPTKTTDALGNVNERIRDPGTGSTVEERSYRKVGTSLVLGSTIRTARDTLGNVTQREVVEANGDATVTTYTYDPAGLAANQTWVAVEDSYATTDPTRHFRTEYDFLRPCGNSSCAPAAVTRIRRFVDASTYLDTTMTYGTGPNFELETIALPDGHQIGLSYYTLTAPPANPTTPADFLVIAKNGRLFEIHHQPGGTPIAEMKTNYAYDESGFVASVTRPVDVVQGDAVTQYLRDDLGRVTQLTNALGDLTKATYTGPDSTSPGELLTLLESGASTTAKGRRQKLVYDTRGRLLEVQRCTDYATSCGAYQLFRRFGYDSESQRLWAEDFTENPPGTLVARRTKLFYDFLGRVKRIEDPLAKATLFEYDERSNLTKRTDALSHITQWSYDALDRMVQETNAISGVTLLGYDAAGNVTTVTDPMSSTTTYGYDGLSRLVSVTQPLGQTVRYEWDARDRLAKKILARSSLGGSSEHPEIRYTYESWGPLALAKHFAKSSDTTPIKTITYVRNRAGDLTSVTDDSIQAGPLYTYEVDKLGRTTKTFAKYIPGGDRRLDYAYDARGDLTTFTLNEPNEVLAHVYTYAADSGRIATALFPGESTALAIARWPHDGVKSIDYPGGVRREVDYDVRGPVSEIRIKPPSGTPLIEKWTYTYTDVLNVASMTDGASRVTSYQYDALDRLTQADHPAMPPPLDSLPDVENFTYDGVGNRTMSGYAHDANHRMRVSPGHTYDYDDDGNRVTRDPNTPAQVTYSWDKTDRLSAYTSSSVVATYIYDPFGRRIRRTSNGTTTPLLWRGDLLEAEYGGTGERITRYAHGEEWSAEAIGAGAPVQNESRRYAGSDQLGAPRLLVSSSGGVNWRATYAAFGTGFVDGDPDGDSQPTTMSARLPGQQFDSDTLLSYSRHRYYDSMTGRFISADPITSLSSGERYSYARSNPLRWIDPLGLQGLDALAYGFGQAYSHDPTLPRASLGRSPHDVAEGARTWAAGIALAISAAQRDALQHCAASCEIARTRGESVAQFLGWANEVDRSVEGGQTTGDRLMDDFNNALGRRYSAQCRSEPDCRNICLRSATSGVLDTADFHGGKQYRVGGGTE